MRVRKLLTKTLADRAWRLRGCVELCGAQPGRVLETPESMDALPTWDTGVAAVTSWRRQKGLAARKMQEVLRMGKQAESEAL